MPSTIQESVNRLVQLVEQSKFLEAIEEFYAPEASMRENQEPPRQGLAALLENERKVLARFAQIHSRAESVVVDGDLAAICWVFEFLTPDGRKFRLEEVAVQHWQNGKILHERFYYDPSQRGVAVA